MTLNAWSGFDCAWERRAPGTNTAGLMSELPSSAVAGNDAPKVRMIPARTALMSVAPARRPPLPQSALPRESPPRVPVPQRALPLSSPRLFGVATVDLSLHRALGTGRSPQQTGGT